jgi:hypothetical protein
MVWSCSLRSPWETGEEQPIRGTLIMSRLFVKKKLPYFYTFECEKECAPQIEKAGLLHA